MATSYSKSFHCWGLGLKPRNASGTFDNTPVTAMIMARGTDFEPNVEFESEDYEGHSGTKTLVLQSDRTSVTSEPEYSHGLVFGECQEEYWYMLLGSATPTTTTGTALTQAQINSDDIIPVKWEFKQDLLNPQILPRATLTNQYMMTKMDAVVFDDCVMNEFSISAGDDGVSCECHFKSSAPYKNQPNQLINTPTELNKLGKEDIRVYILDTNVNFDNLSDAEKLELQYDCVMSLEMNFNNNFDDEACLNTEFGKFAGDEGQFEADGSFEIKWNLKSAFLEDEFYAGEKHGVKATSNSLFKQVIVEMYGKKIGDTTERNMIRIRLPRVEITDASSDMAGDDTKTLNVEYSVRENGSMSPVITTIISPLKELHYGSTLEIDETHVGDSTTDIDTAHASTPVSGAGAGSVVES